jgi:hypothetical protein
MTCGGPFRSGFAGNPLVSTFPIQVKNAINASISSGVKSYWTILRWPGNMACGSSRNTRIHSAPRRSTTLVSSGA